MGRRRSASIAFRVTESEIVDPARVSQGLTVWADYLARQVTRRRQRADRPGPAPPHAP